MSEVEDYAAGQVCKGTYDLAKSGREMPEKVAMEFVRVCAEHYREDEELTVTRLYNHITEAPDEVAALRVALDVAYRDGQRYALHEFGADAEEIDAFIGGLD